MLLRIFDRACAVLSCVLLIINVMGATDSSAADLLEQGIYQEETVGDLEAAIAIYNRIVGDADAERPYAARALYRLGQCLQKSGKEDLAIRTFEKLVAEYPEQSDLVARARRHLPAAEQPAAGPSIEAAPWEDGEHLRFVVKTTSGTPIGDLTFSVQAGNSDGREVWRMKSYMALPKPEIAKYSYVESDRGSALPLETMLYHSQLGTLRARFEEGERRIRTSQPGKPAEPYVQKLDGAVYDNEQAVYLMRRLPLAEGYETHFFIAGRPGAVARADVTVLGIESVTVPAGTFECFKVELGSPPMVQTQWYSTDARRTMVKVAVADIVVELMEISRVRPGPVRYADDEAGVSLAAPRGWEVLKSVFHFEEHEFWVLLMPPELAAKAVLVSQKLDSPVPVREFAEADLGIYKGRRKSFTVREESWTETEVAGAPAVSVLADLESEGTAQVEYRVYVAGPSAYYFFVFRAEPDVFEAMKRDFDSIVESLDLG